jgi:hypothetical protein
VRVRALLLSRSNAGSVRVRARLRPGGTIAISTFANNTLGYPWIGEVVAPFLPQDAGRPDVAQQFLRVDETQLHAQLQQVGFEAPVSEIVEGQFRFASPEQHWGWLMTTGYRFAIQRVDPTQIDRLKAVLAQRLEQHWNGDGYQFDRPTRFTLARRGL